MPVSTEYRQSKRCKHCEETNHGDSVYWNIQLDQDLLSTIVSIYPDWFKGLKANPAMAQCGGAGASGSAMVGGNGSISYPRSPPKAEVDDSPLQKSMDRNKESLKVKLMVRRPINQLVAQGIMPHLKTSPTIHEQRQKLERAKMGDLLKAKIQQRPDRQELVRQHILEADVRHVDPSLAERQRMLKKCRLVDSLNDQLSHRPGPLELIKKNILHTDEPIERAVKEGQIEFKATSEGQKVKPEHPDCYMLDDDSSSDAQSPPSRDCNSTFSEPPPSVELYRPDVLEAAAANAGIVTVLVSPAMLAASPLSLGSSTSSLSPLSSIPSPASFACASPAMRQPAPGKEKNRKKAKSKQQQKTRTIKFHEYKGPPSAQKSVSSSLSNINTNTITSSASNSETSYELLLQQQQLFLQWQLEWHQKHPQMMMPLTQIGDCPASPSIPSPSPSLIERSISPQPPTPPPPPPLPPPPPPPLPNAAVAEKPLRNLEDMKVSDLKAELKKRNLRVSGPKPHLIERLKSSYAEGVNNSNQTNTVSSFIAIPFSDDSIPDSSVPSPIQATNQISMGSVDSLTDSSYYSKPNSPQSYDQSTNKVTSTSLDGSMDLTDEDIIREQQRKIEELQRQLLNSQLMLQQQRQQQQQQQQARTSQTFQPTPAINAKANLAAFLQQQQLNQQLTQQQQKLQKQIEQQQQQQMQMNNKVKSNPNFTRNINNNIVIKNNSSNSNKRERSNTVILGEQPATLLLNHVNVKSDGQQQRTASLPNFMGTFVQPHHLIVSRDGATKQLVFNDGNTVLLPAGIKIENGFDTPHTDVTISSNDYNIKNDDDVVTLHVGEEDNDLEELSCQDEEISKLFKQENPIPLENETVDDVLDMLLKSGEFDTSQPMESSSDMVTVSIPDSYQSMSDSLQSMSESIQSMPDSIKSVSESMQTMPESVSSRSSNDERFASDKPSKYAAPGSLFAAANIDLTVPSQHLSLEELGIDMESFPMDMIDEEGAGTSQTENELMDVDTDWLDRLISSEFDNSLTSAPTSSGYDLLNNDPLELFNIDDNDFKIAAEFSWDRIDFAT